MTYKRTLAPALLIALLTACGASTPTSTPAAPPTPTLVVTPTAAPATSTVNGWLTTPDGSKRLAAQTLNLKSGLTASTNDLTIDPATTYQTIEGFGAALTESSAHLIDTLPPTGRADLLRTLFDPTFGAGLSYVRIPLGASDFALSSYTYDDVPGGGADPTLANLSVTRDERHVLPVARAIRAANGAVRFMGSPWSAPAWMKDGGVLEGGRLAPTALNTYAAYLTRVVTQYAASGVPLSTLTLQNEPRFSTGAYPSMALEPADAARVAVSLASGLRDAGQPTKLLGWDHNWDDLGYARALLGDPDARAALAGTAWHCYAGDERAMSDVKSAFPDKDVYFTECSGGGWATNWGANLAWTTEHLTIGATRNFAKTVLLWNLALDPRGGPTNGGCGNCRGVVTIDPATGAVTLNEEYYALAHVAKFVRPGAVRVASATFGAGNVQSAAFVNPDGTRVMLILNGSGGARKFNVIEKGRGFNVNLPAGSVATYVWR
ncbi:glycoside hydrolase family 30 protein [Deinococcus pimensis]|uniref:glycoside hydrolase family 30 protein n=1 Tax=Deinococcus pimensis TaxID=309888 RepID=UPI0004BCD83F|nr:glycoside hydrolase family 30 beta sandwich domain-containing protein [Deinococcus pimensis]